MATVKDTNYYQISGWMVNRLKLKGYELHAFAIIYSFCQDGEGYYSGSLTYLSEWLGVSRPTVIAILKKLTEKKLLLKEELKVNGITFCKYKLNIDALKNLTGSKDFLPVVKNLNEGSKNSLLGVVKNFNWGSKNSLPNNNKYNNSNNNNNNDVVDKEETSAALTYYEKNVGLLNSVLAENIRTLVDEVGIAAFTKAVDKSVLSNKRNFFYIQKVAQGIAAGDDWDNKSRSDTDDIWGNALKALEGDIDA